MGHPEHEHCTYPCVLFDEDHVILFLCKEVGYYVVEEVLPAGPVGAEWSPDVDLGRVEC